MSYMQLISAVRYHRFKGLGVLIVLLLTQREQMTQREQIFILHYYTQVISQWKVLI